MPQTVQGHQSIIGIYDETTYGVDPGTPSGQLLVLNGSYGIGGKQNRIMDDDALNGTRAAEKPTSGNFDAGGSLPLKIAPTAIGKVLKHALGVVNTSGAGPYTHTITLGDLPTSFMLERDRGAVIAGADRYKKNNGCRISSMAVTIPQEGWPTMAFEVKGAGEAYAATQLDATYDDLGYTPFSSAECTMQEGGASIAYVTEADFTINNNLDEGEFGIGSQNRIALDEGMAMIDGSITALFKDMTLLDKARNSTETSLVFTFTRGDGLGGAGNESLVITLQQLLYQWDGDMVDGPAGVRIKLPFKVYRSGANLGLEMVLKNATATL